MKRTVAAAIVAVALLVVLLLRGVAMEPRLILSNEAGRQVATLALPGGGFVHRYIHSIHKSPVDEEFVVRGMKIDLVRLRYDSYGVGMPSDGGEAFRIEDGRFVVDLRRRFSRLDIRVSHLEGDGLTIGGVFYPFTNWVQPESLIVLKPGERLTFSFRRMFAHERNGSE